jgi:hypothetical protein
MGKLCHFTTRDIGVESWGARVIGTCHLPLPDQGPKDWMVLMHGAKPWWLPQRGKPKLRYSGKAAQVRLLMGQREDNGLLFTGSTPD